MKERPILFNGEMVKAVLEGRNLRTETPPEALPPCPKITDMIATLVRVHNAGYRGQLQPLVLFLLALRDRQSIRELSNGAHADFSSTAASTKNLYKLAYLGRERRKDLPEDSHIYFLTKSGEDRVKLMLLKGEPS